MNNGDELIGYESDEGRELLAQYLRESGASLAMVEQNDQSQNITWPGTVELWTLHTPSAKLSCWPVFSRQS